MACQKKKSDISIGVSCSQMCLALISKCLHANVLIKEEDEVLIVTMSMQRNLYKYCKSHISYFIVHSVSSLVPNTAKRHLTEVQARSLINTGLHQPCMCINSRYLRLSFCIRYRLYLHLSQPECGLQTLCAFPFILSCTAWGRAVNVLLSLFGRAASLLWSRSAPLAVWPTFFENHPLLI